MVHLPLTSHMLIYSYLILYFGHWMKDLGKCGENIFQPLNYIG